MRHTWPAVFAFCAMGLIASGCGSSSSTPDEDKGPPLPDNSLPFTDLVTTSDGGGQHLDSTLDMGVTPTPDTTEDGAGQLSEAGLNLDSTVDVSADSSADSSVDGSGPDPDSTVDTGAPSPCNNGVKDTNETGVDCGGVCTTKCPVNQGCFNSGDCISGLVCFRDICRPSCFFDLGNVEVDNWGNGWDTTERGPSTFADAQATCESKGARLPTATELYRVNANQPGGLAGSTSNYLWSLTPYHGSNQERIRLTTGAITSTAKTSTANYRCICPDVSPTVFDAEACNGPAAGDACFALNARYNMDALDRVGTTLGGAIWECQFSNAHVARLNDYLEAIPAGLPAGSNTNVHIADSSSYGTSGYYNGSISWSGVEGASWSAAAKLTHQTFNTRRPYRCVGLNMTPADHHSGLTAPFANNPSGWKADAQHAPAAAWTASLDACWDQGGHVARAMELQEMIYQGLAAAGVDAGVEARTSDTYRTTGRYTMGITWTGTAPPTSVWFAEHADKQSPVDQAYRCIYYPLDSAYQAPTATDCNGGCTELTVGAGNDAPKMYFDTFDRSPLALEKAAATCRAAGGRLATERDLAEAIRHGLANGSAAALMTAEISTNRYMTVKWTATNTSFTDNSPDTGYATYATVAPYRCMWTNELR